MLHAFALAYVGALLPRAAPLRAALADLSVWLREEAKPAPPPAVEPEPTRRFEVPPAKPRAELRKSKPKPTPKPAIQKSKPAPIRLPYPLEAVARGLEGDVMVRVTLDDTGNVVASRLEASSGHPLLDAAAVQAARGLRGLPDTMARDALIPVRFRLK
jgi:protein TonB